jgi:hypothetical protein
MAMSSEEKALVEGAYNRVRFWGKGANAFAGGAMGAVFVCSHSLVKMLSDPRTSVHQAALFAGLMGVVFSACIVSGFFLSRQRKRDEELIRIFEERFPDECSWKQEEKVLAEAEDLRLKAKADSLMPRAAR